MKLQALWPTQMYFCKICKIFKNTFFYRTPPVAASRDPLKHQFTNDITHSNKSDLVNDNE